ncbi:MAG TPA: S-adenosylmethionine decarboxylase [Gemmatimonadaceae bacterium]|nr:S-adenosylmethionine decarboxylase [Gemmatimonadaceae bacterium]
MIDGCEWLVDAHGCDPVRLADRATLDGLFSDIIAELRLTPVAGAIWHVFPPPGGITGLVPLAESHLTVHTFPEYGSLCLNLFCCRPRPEWPWAERLGESLGAERVEVRRLDRHYASPSLVPAVGALATRHSPRTP